MILSARLMRDTDIEKLKEIHFKYYKGFQFPALKNFLNAYIIEHEDKFVTFGGLEKVLEATCLTDLSLDPQLRATALRKLMRYFKIDADFNGYYQIHSFVTEPRWANRLRKEGFTDCKGESLVLEV